ncbi:homogentisate 1,2-dioxygenase [Sandaracinus amylolyticus]|uniref:Homogentisate 1,2-dioxygenase n=1 Tax=Sandaracinus amylolyticus TaxID=927083 RepID=A0A0F6W5M3_9BACT|nr:homogentisate 1,2-dioxygenase [Sandaracinus amylolyticus]AKF08017.1 Homogentisate 1,2-dioxygenase [Sandaracinus amylolyticus]
MIERLAFGDIPAKHHIALTGSDGELRWEECITQQGFEGPYTIAYHLHRPHEQRLVATTHGWTIPTNASASEDHRLLKRHYKTNELKVKGTAPIDAREPLLFNADVTISIAKPSTPDPVYFVDGDADTLVYVFEGRGTLRTMLGDVRYEQDDYVFVPRGLLHRWIPEGAQSWLIFECHGGLHLPRQWRNEVGQLRMDAPYSHRDFRRPDFVGPVDESIRTQVVRKNGRFHAFALTHSPLDVVGWDGSIYPWAFPILNFQPRAGLVHLPPTWHGTFAIRGGLICSFVPRVVDFHPDAIACPYPHSSVDVDEFLFYVRGNFTSRRGVGPGSVSFHPAGIPHGPHPGAYEKSRGAHRTDELAVMLDCFLPLRPTNAARGVEDAAYQDSFVE